MWGRLKQVGWSWKPGSGLAPYTYFRPGAKTSVRQGAIEGRDFFCSEGDVVAFVKSRRVNGREGRVGAIGEDTRGRAAEDDEHLATHVATRRVYRLTLGGLFDRWHVRSAASESSDIVASLLEGDAIVVPAPPEGARSSLARGRPAAGRRLRKKGAPGSPRDDASAAAEKTAGAYSRASAKSSKPARASRAGPPPKHHLDEPTLKRVRGRLKQACNGVGPLEFLQRFDAGRGALSAGEFKALLRRDLKISFADLGEDDATSLAALLDPDKTGFLAVPGVAHFIQAGVLPAPLLDGPLDDVSALTADTAPPKVSRNSVKKKPAPPNGARNAAKGGAAGSPARKVRTPAPDLSAWALRGRASRKVATADGDVHYLLTLRIHPQAKRAVVVAVNASTDETMSVELGRKALGELQVPHDANVAPDALGAAFAKALRSAA